MLDLNELKKSAQATYLVTDRTIADDIPFKFARAIKEIEDLREFVIWMTGCEYNFTQHQHFCNERDRLLKEYTFTQIKNVEEEREKWLKEKYNNE